MGVREVPFCFCFHFKNLFLFDEMNAEIHEMAERLRAGCPSLAFLGAVRCDDPSEQEKPRHGQPGAFAGHSSETLPAQTNTVAHNAPIH